MKTSCHKCFLSRVLEFIQEACACFKNIDITFWSFFHIKLIAQLTTEVPKLIKNTNLLSQ